MVSENDPSLQEKDCAIPTLNRNVSDLIPSYSVQNMTSLSKEPNKIEGMFNDIAPVYDRLNRLFSLRIDVAWRNYTAKKLVTSWDRKILDVACGSGDLTNALAKKAHKNCEVIGLDFCHPLLKQSANKRPDLSFLRGDGLALPFEDNQFDLVTIAFGLRNMRTIEEGLLEMKRVLKPGGRIGVLEFTEPDSKLLASFHSLYSEKILPKIGDLVSGTKAYSYLNQSVKEWPNAPKLRRIMKKCGYSPVHYHYLHMRNAALHVGTKV